MKVNKLDAKHPKHFIEEEWSWKAKVIEKETREEHNFASILY